MLQRKVLVRTVLKRLKKMINNLGVDPDEWFPPSSSDDITDDYAPSSYEPPYENPLDSMPIAKGSNKYHPDPNYNPTPPRPEEEVADWFQDKKSTPTKEEKTIHEKMYEIATAKYNPFAIGGSETLGGSENVHEKD